MGCSAHLIAICYSPVPTPLPLGVLVLLARTNDKNLWPPVLPVTWLGGALLGPLFPPQEIQDLVRSPDTSKAEQILFVIFTLLASNLEQSSHFGKRDGFST